MRSEKLPVEKRRPIFGMRQSPFRARRRCLGYLDDGTVTYGEGQGHMSTDTRATSGAGPRGTARRLPAELRRSQLLDVAAELVAEHGAEAVTMEGVAARAGVSKALGYRYFDNADELLLTLHEREMAGVGARVADAMAGATTFEATIRTSLTTWLDILDERGPVITNLMQARPISGPVERQSRAIHAMVSEFYGERAAEDFGLSPRTATAAASVLLSGLDGLIDCWRHRAMPRRELIDIYTTMCVGAMQALADEPPLIGGPQTAPHSTAGGPTGPT